MKYLWDIKYVKISFYIVLSFICMYISFLTIGLLPGVVKKLFVLLVKIFFLFTPFWIGLILAYLLDPIVAWIQEKTGGKKGKEDHNRYQKRTLATFITYGIFIGVFLLLSILLFHNLEQTDMDGFVYRTQASVDGFIHFLKKLHENLLGFQFWRENHKAIIDEGMNMLIQWAESFGEKAVGSASQVTGKVFKGILSLVIAFYLLKDKGFFLSQSKLFFQWLFKGKYEKIYTFFKSVHVLLSGYVRGQLLDSLIVGTCVGVVLSVVGVQFSMGIGFFSAFGNLIPYVGSFTTFTLTVIIALLTDGVGKAAIAAISIIVIQQVDSNFIGPRIVGKSVRLHPIAVILSLSIAGSLFGLAGLMLAVPFVAVVKLVLWQLFQKKQME